MSTFEPDMTPRFAQLLDQRETQLRAVLAEEAERERAVAEEADRGQEVTDFKELAEEATMSAVHEMQHAHALAELEAIGAARQRLAEGLYGLCIACGEPIELRRLEAMPTALRCMRCQSLSERGAGTPG